MHFSSSYSSIFMLYLCHTLEYIVHEYNSRERLEGYINKVMELNLHARMILNNLEKP